MSKIEINRNLMLEIFGALITRGEAEVVSDLYESGAKRDQASSIDEGLGRMLLQIFMYRAADEALANDLIKLGVVPDKAHFVQALNTRNPSTVRKIMDAMTEEGRREAIVPVSKALSAVNPNRYSFYKYSTFEHFLLETREILINGEPLPRGSLSFLADKAPDNETRKRFLDLMPRTSFKEWGFSAPSGVGT